MPDDKRKKIPHDSKRINLDQPYEVEYWKNRFNISAEQLRAIVAMVGDSVEDIQKYLSKLKR